MDIFPPMRKTEETATVTGLIGIAGRIKTGGG